MQLSLISLALTKVYGGVAAFSPSSLFASGEQGAWYDPSDLSTMFQDYAGTTPVTADGQPVGLILDKSKGLVLSAEKLTYTTFDSLTGWGVYGAIPYPTFEAVGGRLHAIATGARALAGAVTGNLFSGVLAGQIYEFTATLEVVSGVGPSIGLNTFDQNTSLISIFFSSNAAVGTHNIRSRSLIFTSSSTAQLTFENASTKSGEWYLDNVSIKLVQGNHASQINAASRPLYKTDGTYHWLQFDGVDDSLSTAAINFTSTDKMSVFAGLVTTDNVGFDGIIQLGSLASGGFWSYFNEATLEFKVQGSSGVSAVSSAYTPASRSVLTSLMNLGGATGQNCLSTRKNASLFANASIVAGAANFQNGVMTIGVTTGVLLTGNIYSLIVRGALSTTDEITATETWVNQRTGAY